MKAVFHYTLSGFRWAMVGWGLGLGLLGGYLIPFYDTIFEQRAQWEELLRAYPRELLVFFGEIQDIADPATYLHAQFFSWLPLILGFFRHPRRQRPDRRAGGGEDSWICSSGSR
jgi:ABC-2 type transport system permease protein